MIEGLPDEPVGPDVLPIPAEIGSVLEFGPASVDQAVDGFHAVVVAYKVVDPVALVEQVLMSLFIEPVFPEGYLINRLREIRALGRVRLVGSNACPAARSL